MQNMLQPSKAHDLYFNAFWSECKNRFFWDIEKKSFLALKTGIEQPTGKKRKINSHQH